MSNGCEDIGNKYFRDIETNFIGTSYCFFFLPYCWTAWVKQLFILVVKTGYILFYCFHLFSVFCISSAVLGRR